LIAGAAFITVTSTAPETATPEIMHPLTGNETDRVALPIACITIPFGQVIAFEVWIWAAIASAFASALFEGSIVGSSFTNASVTALPCESALDPIACEAAWSDSAPVSTVGTSSDVASDPPHATDTLAASEITTLHQSDRFMPNRTRARRGSCALLLFV